MGKGVELTGKNKEKIYPITASDLVYDKDTKQNMKTSLANKVEEAPKDGKQYARMNGAWAEVEAGAVSETALISITPALDDLKGVSVTVTTGEGETILNTTWQGSVLAAQIRAGLQYTVAVGNKDGFIAPSSVTYTAEKGVSRSINMNYTESRLKVSILSNQSNDATIAAVKATVKYGSTSIQVTNGGYVNLPLNTSVTITFPAVEGYKTPDSITYIHTGGSYEKTGIYQTEVVRVTLSADNGADLSGQVITINGVQHTWGGTVVEQKVAFGAEYTVSVSDKDGYTTPASQSYVAAESYRDLSFLYEERQYGVYIRGYSGKLYRSSSWASQEGVDCIALIYTNAYGDMYNIGIRPEEFDNLSWCNTLEYVTSITDRNGQNNTTLLVNKYGSEAPAAYNCNSYGYYLPSLYELEAIASNKTEIRNALNAIYNEKPFASDLNRRYWTSSQKDANNAYYYDFSYTNPTTGNETKTTENYVLAIKSLN